MADLPGERRPPPKASLPELVQRLPQELYDEIYKLTFTAEPDTVVNIEHVNPFSAMLHVDARSREIFAESYYSTTHFTFKYGPHKDLSFLYRWFGTLSDRHNHLVSSLVAKMDMHMLDTSHRASYINTQKNFAADEFLAVSRWLGGVALVEMKHVLRIQVWPGWGEGITTETRGAWLRRLRQAGQHVGGPYRPPWSYMRATLGGEEV